jgi:hypothetical protein
VLVGGALDEAADPASVGSFFEAPNEVGFVKPAASWDEEDDEQDAGLGNKR